MFGRQAAAEYDVGFYTNVGQFRTETSEIRRQWASTTGAMSDDSLRAAVAQEKLDRALARHGPESFAAKNATLAYRREMEQLGSQSVRTGAGVRTADRDMERFGRGAVLGTGILHGFGRAAIYASTSLLGGYGLVYAIRSVVNASKEEEVALAQVQNALRNTGLSWGVYGRQIGDATNQLESQTAFTREELDAGLAQLIRRTGDVADSIRLASVAADVARGRNMDYASTISLIIKALNGQTGALRRLGIDVKTVTTAQDELRSSGVKASQQQQAAAKAADQLATRESAVAALRAKYSGQAAAYLKTEAGQQDLVNARLKDSEAIIGDGLRPALLAFLGPFAHWLDQLNRTGQLQRDVNQAEHDAAVVLDTLRRAYQLAEPEIELVNKALGGTDHALQSLTLAVIAWKTGGFLGLTGSFGKVATEAGEAGAAGRVALLLSRLKTLAAFGVITLTIDLLVNDPGHWMEKIDGFLAKGVDDWTSLLHLGRPLQAAEGGGKYGTDFGTPGRKVMPGGHVPLRFPANPTPSQVAAFAQADGLSKGLAAVFSALIGVESNYHQYGPGGAVLRSSAGALGLSQLMPSTAASLGVNPSDPRQNVLGGISYFASNYRSFLKLAKGNQQLAIQLALAAYNAGAGAVTSRYRRGGLAEVFAEPNGPNSTVGDYVSSILNAAGYGNLAGAGAGAGGGGGGGGGGGSGVRTDVSFALKNALLDAQMTKTTKDDLRVYRQQKAYLFGLLNQHGLTHADILTIKGELVGVTDEITSLTTGVTSKRAKTAREAEAALQKAVRATIKQLTSVPVDLQVAEKTAKTEQQKLAILRKELAAVQEQIQVLRHLNLGKDAIEKARLKEADIQKKINDLEKKKTADASAAAFFAEAADEQSLYGSNLGRDGYPLSGQDARGALGRIALHLKAIERHTRQTATSTTTTAKDRPTMLHAARALAGAGI